MRLAVVLAFLSGCVELGVVSDGSSISVGKPSRGRIVDGVRLPDQGEGYVTREIWRTRGNRFGTDELVDLITGVARRVTPKNDGIRLAVADLSGKGGGAARQWHRSHQSGRDVDLLFYLRDRNGKPVEDDVMRVIGPNLVARDGSGYTVDVPRMWNLVRELLTAPEAPVQWVFVYQPVANALIEHAIAIGEPEVLVERARKACKQPGDSAPHNDHLHVRVYCSYQDRAFGCVDVGPMELLAEREADFQQQQLQVASALENPAGIAAATGGAPTFTEAVQAQLAAPAGPAATVTPSAAPANDLRSLQRLLRTGAYRVNLWRWR